jgi:hypothetical protein
MHIWGWLGSGLLVVITWILTVHTITTHLTNYNNKGIQRHKVRVLAYPAVYATLAWYVNSATLPCYSNLSNTGSDFQGVLSEIWRIDHYHVFCILV